MKRLDQSSVATLIFTFTMTITLGLMALYIGFDWQHTLFLSFLRRIPLPQGT